MSIRVLVLRSAYWIVLISVVLAAACLLVARFWLIPHVNQWREPIANHLSQVTGADVEIGSINGYWHGWHPRFTFNNIRVGETGRTAAAPQVQVATLSAELAWRPLLSGELTFASLSMRGIDIDVERTKDNHLLIAGQIIDLTRGSMPAQLGDYPVMRWLRDQQHVSLDEATLRWRDTRRNAPVLTFENLSMSLHNIGDRHQIAIHAMPDAAIGGPVNIKADLHAGLFQTDAVATMAAQGTLYVDVDNVQIQHLPPWLDVDGWRGAMSARGWVDFDSGKIADVRADIRTRDLTWQDQTGNRISTRTLNGTVHGAASDVLPDQLNPAMVSPTQRGGINLTVDAEGVESALQEWFEGPPWQLRSVHAQASVSRLDASSLAIRLNKATVDSDDVVASLQGEWSNDKSDPLGRLDLSVDFERVRMNAIHRYLPKEISSPARHWLGAALVAGDVREGTLAVRGPLRAFPFEDSRAEEGVFSVSGAIRDATLDYLPTWRELGHLKAWPRIETVQGRFNIDKTALTIQVDSGLARMVGEAHAIQVGSVLAHIPDMEHDATLMLNGSTHGELAAYLALVSSSALDDMTDGVLRGLRGSGRMHMPLVLNVPLTHSRDTTLRGDLIFDKNDVWLRPGVPPLGGLDGRLVFTRDALRAADMRANWLGGNVRASGTLSHANNSVMQINGRASAAALHAWDKGRTPILKRLSGQLDYQASLRANNRGLSLVRVQSNLIGLAVDLPEPFSKDKAATIPVQAIWQARKALGGTTMFEAQVGDHTRIQIEPSGSTSKGTSVLTRAAIAIDRPLVLPDRGLRVDAALARADSWRWRDVVRDIEVMTAGPSEPSSKKDDPTRSVIGPERDVHLQIAHLETGRFAMDDLRMHARRALDGNDSVWHVALNSRQAEGTMDWRQSSVSTGDNVLRARLKRLSLQPSEIPKTEREQAAQAVADHAVEDLSEVPAIDVHIDDFSFKGRTLGQLEVKGVNMENGNQWRLDHLTLHHPNVDLQASGMWTARGEQRGLVADSRVTIHNLGGLLDQLGAPDLIERGQGTIDARLNWHNSPWTHRLQDVNGELAVNLTSGRFIQAQSASVKLLELLSLQSLERIATLKANPFDAVRSGFPFDEIKSQLRIDAGVLKIDDYAIDSPVARIKLAGESDLAAQTWNLDAKVVPKLDVSGAALLAGFIVNPIVGVAAMVTQWVLKTPLQSMFSTRYRISGSWDVPQIDVIDRPEHARTDRVEKIKGTATDSRNALESTP